MSETKKIPGVETNLFNSLKSFAIGASIFVSGVGCLVLVGWALDLDMLRNILPGQANMKANTALLLVLCGISLWAQIKGQFKQMAQICAVVVALSGFLTLSEYLLHVDFGIDQLLFHDTTSGVLFPGRMAPATTMSFLLIGLALASLDGQSRYLFNQSLVIVVMTISSLALIGYLYGESAFYEVGVYTAMSWHTALSFVLLSLGVLAARPERGLMRTILADTLGGNILRRFLPAAIVIPVLLGWIGLWGQRRGLYDTALEIALIVVSLMITISILIWLNALQLTLIDIKRKQIDANLRENELRFRSTLDSMMEGCQIIGYDWRYLYINASAEKHNRRPNKELMGKIYMDMWPGIESTAVFIALQRCMEKRESQHMINEFVYPDGSTGWFELGIQPVLDGIFILSSDITRHKQAEQTLLEREMKLTTLFEILPVGISILDKERKVSYTNPALKKILDISEEGLLNGTYKNRKYLRADGTPLPIEERASTRAFEEEVEIDGIETGVVKESGNVVWTEVSAVPVNFSDWKVVVVTSDITERKRAEDEIIKLNAELEETVAKRTAELAKANKQLQELAIADELTGLYNRRGFLLLAEEQLLLARRAKWNMLLFYADLDGLKQINDQFGHITGDEAIVKAAHALNATFRTSDIKARLGGDEFIVLAMEAEEHNSQILQERLHQHLAENNQSMSIGVITFSAQEKISLEDLVAQADQAMYAQKRSKPDRNEE